MSPSLAINELKFTCPKFHRLYHAAANIMSLYHEAAEILTAANKDGGSLKSLVFGRKTWKSDGRSLFALSAEGAKWSSVLSEVVEKSGVLKVEKNVSRLLHLRRAL